MDKNLIKGLVITLFLVGLLSCTQATSKSEEVIPAKNASQSNVRLLLDNEPDLRRAALINVELGLGYLAQGQVARAKSKLMHAVKLAPNEPEPHSALAHFLEMTGEFKDAERQYKKAVSIAHNGAVYNNYGAFLCRRGRYKEADKAFLQAIEDKIYPRTAEVYENAGICALKWPNVAKAEEYLNIAVRRDPQRMSALLTLVELDLEHDKLIEAKNLLNHYRNVAEPSARSLWLGIKVSKRLQDDNGVANQALMLKNLFEDSSEYKQYLTSEKAER